MVVAKDGAVSWFEAYVAFGIPAILVLGGIALAVYARWDYRRSTR